MKGSLLFLISVLLAPYQIMGEVYKITIPEVEVKNNRLNIEGYGSVSKPGLPLIPAKSVWLIVPPKSEITTCKVTRKLQPLPDKYSIQCPTSLFAPNKVTEGALIEREVRPQTDTTSHTEMYPSIAGKCLGIYDLFGYEMAKIAIFPVAYNPREEKWWYSNEITITIEYTIPNKQVEEVRPQVDTTLDALFSSNVINFSECRRWYKPKQNTLDTSYNYVIIADNVPILRDFISWKESIGYKVKILPHSRINELGRPKYVLIIGNPIEIEGPIIGRIPYTEPRLIASILERTIEFELGKSQKSILFVKGIANYENENYSGIPAEDKSTLIKKLKPIIPDRGAISRGATSNWKLDEVESGKIISGDYSIINFLTLGKKWIVDDGDNVPEGGATSEEEIKVSKYSLLNAGLSIIFAPFEGQEFLKQSAVSVIAPSSNSQYVVGWDDLSDGGNQSFNYLFLKCLLKDATPLSSGCSTVGEAFREARFWYETYFPYDTLGFKIWGDPSLSLQGIPGVDIKISTSTPSEVASLKWIPPDSGFLPMCKVVNLGILNETKCKVNCEIESCDVEIYESSVVIDTIKPMEERIIEFPEWTTPQMGVEYRVKYEVFSMQDENLENDTFSISLYVAKGDFIIVEAKSRLGGVGPASATAIHQELTRLGYRGAVTMDIASCTQWMNNFGSIFILDDDSTFLTNLDTSGFPLRYNNPNIYIEGQNRWLSNLSAGKQINQDIIPPIYGMNISFTPLEEVTNSNYWFIPDNSIPIFTDANRNVVSFCYQTEGSRGSPDPQAIKYKIWSSRITLASIPDSIRIQVLDSVMQFFSLTADSGLRGAEYKHFLISSFECLPNPFYKRTEVKFKIENKRGATSTCHVNLSVYNLAGTKVKQLLKDQKIAPGEHKVVWDATDEQGKLVVNGIYFLRLQVEVKPLSGELIEPENRLIKLIVFR
ncbi:MAG: hypothetical protein HY769_05115 [Candidatus Stahlbacteria bacterium]|nr:hypothetical protein [Candidatus Stahlbacteria bacterium]